MKVTVDNSSNSGSEASQIAKIQYEQSKKAMSSLLDIVDSIVNDDQSTLPTENMMPLLSNFLTLKQSQRRLGLLVHSDLDKQVSNSKKRAEESTLNLQNLLYEKKHLENEIESMKQFDSHHLLEMAKQELQCLDEEGGEMKNAEDVNPDEMIDAFLKPAKAKESYSHRDISHHNSNLSKIYKETNGRGILQKELNAKQKEKEELERVYMDKKGFLKNVPAQVKKLEQACNFMQKYIKDHSSDDVSMEVLPQSNLQRKELLDQALELSPCLYTIFVQIQSFLDATNSGYSSHSYDGWELNIIDATVDSGFHLGQDEKEAPFDMILKKSDKCLQLSIPVPHDTKTATLGLCFEYFSYIKIVTVRCETNGATFDELFWSGSEILTNLFEEDTGRDLPSGVAARVVFENHSDSDKGDDDDDDRQIEDEEEEEEEEEEDNVEENDLKLSPVETALFKIRQSLQMNRSITRPYSWCQYLSGIHYPKTNSKYQEGGDLLRQAGLNATTRAVLQQIQRRIRSHSTLLKLTNILSTCPLNLSDLPCHAGTELPTPQNIRTKIAAFKVDADLTNQNSTGAKYYSITLQKEDKEFEVSVKVECSYPATPPMFSLQKATQFSREQVPEASKKPKLAIVEKYKSFDPPLYDEAIGSIEYAINSLQQPDLFYDEKVEESYDFILIQQLRFFIQEWERVQM
jgi:hypothetical protein